MTSTLGPTIGLRGMPQCFNLIERTPINKSRMDEIILILQI